MPFEPIFFKVKMETILYQVRKINTCLSIFTLMTSNMSISALNIKLRDNCIPYPSTIKCTLLDILFECNCFRSPSSPDRNVHDLW